VLWYARPAVWAGAHGEHGGGEDHCGHLKLIEQMHGVHCQTNRLSMCQGGPHMGGPVFLRSAELVCSDWGIGMTISTYSGLQLGAKPPTFLNRDRLAYERAQQQ
jgi:hypothetical protein